MQIVCIGIHIVVLAFYYIIESNETLKMVGGFLDDFVNLNVCRNRADYTILNICILTLI